MPNESQEAKRWVVARLQPARVYADIAPAGAAHPFVVFNLQSAHDVQGLGTERALCWLLLQVRVIAEGKPDAETRSLAAFVDERLGRASAEESGGYVFSARRRRPIDRAELVAGVTRFHNLGGLYDVAVSRPFA